MLTGKHVLEEVEEIRSRLSEIFDLPEQELSAIVSGKPLTIKKNIPAPSAMKYKKALSQCGLECLIEPMDEPSLLDAEDLESAKRREVPTQTQVTTPAPAPAQEAKTPAATASDSVPSPVAAKSSGDAKMILAPAGARIGPRPSVARHDIPSVDHLEAGFADRLAPESPEGPKPPSVDHLEADFADRLAPESPQGPPPPSVDHLDMAAPGERLGPEKKDEKLELDLSHLALNTPKGSE